MSAGELRNSSKLRLFGMHVGFGRKWAADAVTSVTLSDDCWRVTLSNRYSTRAGG